MTALDHSRIRAEVVREALANKGYGETGGNNRGQFIRALGGIQGQEWCALFVTWCYRTAYERCKQPHPDWCYARRNRLQTSAKALTKALGRVGSMWKPGLRQPKPGDLVCWSRGVLGWQGHVGIALERGQYISGNEGRLGTVTVRSIALSKLTLWRFASLELMP